MPRIYDKATGTLFAAIDRSVADEYREKGNRVRAAEAEREVADDYRRAGNSAAAKRAEYRASLDERTAENQSRRPSSCIIS